MDFMVSLTAARAAAAPYWLFGRKVRTPIPPPGTLRNVRGMAVLSAELIARPTFDSKSQHNLFTVWIVLAVLLCSAVHAASVGGIWTGLIQSVHGTFVWNGTLVWRVYTVSCSASPEYPRSADCSLGMMVNSLIRSTVKARMLVEHGRGARLGRVPMAATASAYVTMG